MAELVYRGVSATGGRLWGTLAALGAVIAAGFAAFVHMETHGHVVTGMDNQIVWGLPHVFAVVLIVAASGALNAASIASVFGRVEYKPLARLSAVSAIALLAGGLAILVADLGRPDRLVVAMTHYNWKSIFAWNMVLYNGFFALAAAYLWFMMERQMNAWSGAVGLAAFLWRIVLTTGTGSIFGFLVAREALDSALLGPLFVVYSFAYGGAAFVLVLALAWRWDGRPSEPEVLARLARLLAYFVAASLYGTVIFHLTKFYMTRTHGVEEFLLLSGGIYPALFWLGQVALGGVAPLVLLRTGRTRGSQFAVHAAAVLVLAGGFAQMYVTIVGSQAWPQPIFPGWQESSRFFDGEIHPYTPSVWELALGAGGVAFALALAAVALKALPLLADPCTDSSSAPPTSPPARPR